MARIALALLLVACGAQDSLEDQRTEGGASGSSDSTVVGPGGSGPRPGGSGPRPGGSGPGPGGSGPGSGGFGGAGGAEPTYVVQLSAGFHHTCARLDTGAVRCWGAAGSTSGSPLGYGNLNNIGDNETPASAGDVDVGGPAVDVTAGLIHTCARLTTGAVRCWGSGQGGQLGYGNTLAIGDDETPSSAGDLELGATAANVSAGGYHSCALLAAGNVRCWGHANANGHPNVIGDDETPGSVGDVLVGGTVMQVVTGWDHSCALMSTGNVRCWGEGFFGTLGYANQNTIGDDETPASAGDLDLGGAAVQIVTQASHTCALLTSGEVRCWGTGTFNRLGYGNTNTIGDDETPASAGSVDVGGAVVQLAAGQTHTCALLVTGAVRCWGYGPYGQLGYPNTTEVLGVPASAGDVDVGGPVSQIVAGYNHTCALLQSGDVRCWGSGYGGKLGYGNTEHIGIYETPASAGSVQVL